MKKSQPPYCRVQDRPAKLAELRNLKMARSAHAYVRGNTRKFYEWLKAAGGAVPAGPAVWICGDCHAGNLGPVANAKGDIDIQIRDLDQAVVGNPAHDLIRLGLSLACAARGSDLPGVTTARMMENLMAGYDLAFSDGADAAAGGLERPKAVGAALRAALRRKWKHLARERIKGATPRIPLGRHFWPLARTEKKEIGRLFAEDDVRRMVTSLRSRDDEAAVEVLDAAFWVKGCSSLGNLRYAVLVRVGGGDGDGESCLIDVKEAMPAVAPRSPGAKMPKDHAERVVRGAWHLSPALGDRMTAGRVLDRPVFLRELLPQDLKFEIASLTPAEATRVAAFLASIVGKAHARQMDGATRRAWRKSLGDHRSKTLDAPSWLWSSVVAMLVAHEGEYLEHCRRFAMTVA